MYCMSIIMTVAIISPERTDSIWPRPLIGQTEKFNYHLDYVIASRFHSGPKPILDVPVMGYDLLL